MNYYYIPSSTDQGYVQIAESEFLGIVAEKQRKNYANKVYYGKIELDSIPEEHREAVQTLVAERVAKHGRFEDKRISPFEVRQFVEGIPGVELTRAATKTLFADIERLRNGATDAVALTAATVYPRLKGNGSLVKACTRINWNGNLYRATVDLWDTAENTPDNAYNLWERINETHSGTLDDAIPYNGNMVLENGKYYTQDGVIYLCNRDTGNPVYNALSELVGLYVEEA